MIGCMMPKRCVRRVLIIASSEQTVSQIVRCATPRRNRNRQESPPRRIHSDCARIRSNPEIIHDEKAMPGEESG